MNKIPQQLDDALLNYLDGVLSQDERMALEQTLQNDPALRKRLEELRQTDVALHFIKLQEPSDDFTSLVMKKLDYQTSPNGMGIRTGLFLLTGIILAVITGAILLAAGVFDQATTMLDVSKLGVPANTMKDIPAIHIDGKMVINIILLLNLAIGFIVLDKAILKPYFQRRMEASH